jgi:hypothetical protein
MAKVARGHTEQVAAFGRNLNCSLSGKIVQKKQPLSLLQISIQNI